MFPGIRETVGQHSLIHMFGEGAQNAASDVMLASWQGEARQGNHGVAAPVAEPVIAGDDCLLLTARDYVLLCRGG